MDEKLNKQHWIFDTMTDVMEVRQDSFITETSSTKKTRKVKKTKRRESSDGIKITEIESSGIELVGEQDEEGYLNELKSVRFIYLICISSYNKHARTV